MNKHSTSPLIHSNILAISDPFKGILLDAYGVFWGGNASGVIPGSKEMMERLVSDGKVVGIVSNSTQLVQNEIDKLKTHGLIQGIHFHFLITSGETAKNIFSNKELTFPTPNKKFYVVGEDHPHFSSHETLFAASPYRETKSISEADFLYVAIPHINGKDQINPQIFEEKINALYQFKLPMVCANPDQIAHEGSPPRPVVRQGAIASIYEKLGGDVFYIGKPSNKMFLVAMNQLLQYKIDNIQDVLMVGDTPETDIRGASNFGISSALIIKTGVTAERIATHGFENVIKSFPPQDSPTFFIEKLA